MAVDFQVRMGVVGLGDCLAGQVTKETLVDVVPRPAILANQSLSPIQDIIILSAHFLPVFTYIADSTQVPALILL